MGKLKRLRDNIDAICMACGVGRKDPSVLEKYTGFGGLGFVLNPLNKDAWSKSDIECYHDTVRMYDKIRELAPDDKTYNLLVSGLKASVLTAFYTPEEFVRTLFEMLSCHAQCMCDINVYKRFLDPAAGNGVFVKNASAVLSPEMTSVAYEIDYLTSKILHHQVEEKKIKVRNFGFETIPADELGTYDLVSTNVPFGNIPVYDKDYKKSGNAARRDAAKMIHRYYMMKGLDCLRNGGIEAFITTSNYLNNDTEQLAEVLSKARLIGAYRLPNNMFKEAGTEVGSDLIVLQKDEKKNGLTADESFLLTMCEHDGCKSNMYFTVRQDHMICTSSNVGTDAYGKRCMLFSHAGGVSGISGDIGALFYNDLMANVDVKLLTNGAKRVVETGKKPSTKESTSNIQEKHLFKMNACYTQMYENEATNKEEDVENRALLNSLYDEYVERYGRINSDGNAKIIKAMKIQEILGIERYDEEGKCWEKADILLHPTAFVNDGRHADTPHEALAHSLNEYGKPNMEYMVDLTGMDEEKIINALRGEIFWNPLSKEYEIKAKFVSGNVVEKINLIKGMLQNERSVDIRTETALAALNDAIPTPIPYEELDFNLGERWIDCRIYVDFATEFFSVPGKNHSWLKEDFRVDVRYNAVMDQFAVQSNVWSEKITTMYYVSSETGQRFDGLDLFTHALHNTCPKMMKYKRNADGHYIYNDNGTKEKEEDHEKTMLANSKIEEIRQGFQDWLMSRPKDFRDRLSELYNKRFNCFVKPKYDGSHQTFPGIDMKGLEKKYGVKSIYSSQKDCVWMLVLNGGGICDHEVGSGKTLIMCMAAHEMKRLGMCHKPIIIGLKANVSAIAETYKTAYPKANILFAKEGDYSGENRVAFFNKIKNNDWECVIMSHEQFGRIPQSKEIEVENMQDELKQLEDALCVVKGWDSMMSARVRKGLEKRKINMEIKMKELMDSISNNKDEVIDFNLMGIDHIFVDESHQFKNLGFSTRHERVAGMGNTEGSKRAYNLLMAISTIQKKTGRDLGATFLSGTTVTNSLTELYSLFRYLRPKALAKQNITCFDSWAAIFTKKSNEFEFSITNQIVLKERFRYFIKVPELAMFYNEITDFRTAEDVGIDRPKKKVMLLNITPTPDQEEYIKRLIEFSKSGDFSLIGIEHPTDNQKTARMLYATDCARKMSMDMRMIDMAYEDHPRNKASQCAKLIKRYYDKYNSQKGTQLVFSDLSTWRKNSEWCVYGEIKKKLVEEYGIPADEIRFIQEAKCDSKKQKLIEDVNAGKVRVLFGSTSMLGTGVNAQKRVVAVHHLDTPWRPSDLEQRDGRAIRKGNDVAKKYADNKVDIIIYAVERSLDSYKFNLLHCKQTFISQLKRGQLAKRTLDEGSMDENGMNFSEYMAILSGNTDLLERAKLEKKIAGLESERKNFLRDQRNQKEKMEALRLDNETHEKNIKSANDDYERLSAVLRYDEDGNVVNNLTIDGFLLPENAVNGSEEWEKAVGNRLLAISSKAKTNGIYHKIGSIYGFNVLVKTVEGGYDNLGNILYDNIFYVEGQTIKYNHNHGKLLKSSARQSSWNMMKALMNIPNLISGWQSKMEENAARIEQLKAILDCTWTKEGKLRQLKSELSMLDRKINEELNSSKDADKSVDKTSDVSDVKKAA